MLTSGFGSLSRLINKKEELSKSNKDLNTKQKKGVKFSEQKGKENNNNNSGIKNSRKILFSEKIKNPQKNENLLSYSNKEQFILSNFSLFLRKALYKEGAHNNAIFSFLFFLA